MTKIHWQELNTICKEAARLFNKPHPDFIIATGDSLIIAQLISQHMVGTKVVTNVEGINYANTVLLFSIYNDEEFNNTCKLAYERPYNITTAVLYDIGDYYTSMSYRLTPEKVIMPWELA